MFISPLRSPDLPHPEVGRTTQTSQNIVVVMDLCNSESRYVSVYNVLEFSLRFIAVLVNHEQSESMHIVWCLLCIFPRLFLLGWSWHRCISDTNQQNLGCIALAGTSGKNVYCTIYENSSSTCRELAMSCEKRNINDAYSRTNTSYILLLNRYFCILTNTWQDYVHLGR